jgi:hypothetical protein
MAKILLSSNDRWNNLMWSYCDTRVQENILQIKLDFGFILFGANMLTKWCEIVSTIFRSKYYLESRIKFQWPWFLEINNAESWIELSTTYCSQLLLTSRNHVVKLLIQMSWEHQREKALRLGAPVKKLLI